MIVRGVDPRDVCWEAEHPVYRVYFWHQEQAPAGVRQQDMMFHADEYRLTEASDVVEVLDWARAVARPDQTFTLHVEHREADRLGLILLTGIDPTSSA